MSGLRWLDVPFRYTTKSDFQRKLTAWLSEIFYEVLPRHGYEVREEQIYTAFRIAETLLRRETLLAEAGSGTGKTFAYLLPAVCYARYAGKPAILSSASSLLQEQLAGGEAGDIFALSRLLDLRIDARVAKDPRNYLCQRKAEQLAWEEESSEARRLNAWRLDTTLGDRAEIPEISDQLWQSVAWDETLVCDRCQRRGYCQVAKNRLHVWAAQDFVVCSHDQFFRHLWSRSHRQNEGLPPLLPATSAVIFDEGHLLERPAIEQLGHSLREQLIISIHQAMWVYRQALWSKLILTLEALEQETRRFFALVRQSLVPNDAAERWFVNLDARLVGQAERLLHTLRQTADQLAINGDLLLGTPVEDEFRVASQRLDQAEAALLQLSRPAGESVVWWEPATETLWALPGSFGTLIGQELTQEPQPLIFTSATLQAGGSFSGMKQLLGLPQAGTSRVTTSFQLAEQMVAYLPEHTAADFPARADQCLRLLEQNQGRALVLLRSSAELQQWRAYLRDKHPAFPLLWEGDAERGWLLQQFRRQTSSVLIGTSFWEGVDVPGEALSLLIVFSLPFPEPDPLLLSKRWAAEQADLDPWVTIDLTEMVIRLRQGFGRLIRTAADRGMIAVLDPGADGQSREAIRNALPDGVAVFSDVGAAMEAMQIRSQV